MKPIEIAVIVIVVVLFVAAMSYIIYRKVKHKGSCDCGCSGCSACSAKDHDKTDGGKSSCCCCGGAVQSNRNEIDATQEKTTDKKDD